MGGINELVRFEDGSILCHGDYVDVLRELYADQASLPCNGHAQSVITDPPYANTHAFWDKKIDWKAFWILMQEFQQPNTSYVMFCCGKFMFDLHDSNPSWYRYDLVWYKFYIAGFLNANHMPIRKHENILVFCKLGNIRNMVYRRYKDDDVVYNRKLNTSKKSGIYGSFKSCAQPTFSTLSKVQTSVLNIDDRPCPNARLHNTEKSLSLMKALVQSYSTPDGLVIDPFCGSGTLARACQLTNRRFITIEKDKDIFAIAKSRLQEQIILKKSENKLQKLLFPTDNTNMTTSSNAHNQQDNDEK